METSNYQNSTNAINDQHLVLNQDEDGNIDDIILTKEAAETLVMLSNSLEKTEIISTGKKDVNHEYEKKCNESSLLPELTNLPEDYDAKAENIPSDKCSKSLLLREKEHLNDDKSNFAVLRKRRLECQCDHIHEPWAKYYCAEVTRSKKIKCQDKCGYESRRMYSYKIENRKIRADPYRFFQKIDYASFSSRTCFFELAHYYCVESSKKIIDDIILKRDKNATLCDNYRYKDINYLAKNMMAIIASRSSYISSFAAIDDLFKIDEAAPKHTIKTLRNSIYSYIINGLQREVYYNFKIADCELKDFIYIPSMVKHDLASYVSSVNMELSNVLVSSVEKLIENIADIDFIKRVSFKKIDGLDIGIPSKQYAKLLILREGFFFNMSSVEKKYSRKLTTRKNIQKLSEIEPEILMKMNHELVELRISAIKIAKTVPFILSENDSIEQINDIQRRFLCDKFIDETKERYVPRINAIRRMLLSRLNLTLSHKSSYEYYNETREAGHYLDNVKNLDHAILEILRPLCKKISSTIVESLLKKVTKEISEIVKYTFIEAIFTKITQFFISSLSKMKIVKELDKKIDSITVKEGMNINRLCDDFFGKDIRDSLRNELCNKLDLNSNTITKFIPKRISSSYKIKNRRTKLKISAEINGSSVEDIVSECLADPLNKITDFISSKIVTNSFFILCISCKLFSPAGEIGYMFTKKDAECISSVRNKVFNDLIEFEETLREEKIHIDNARVVNRSKKTYDAIYKRLLSTISKETPEIEKIIKPSTIILEPNLNVVYKVSPSIIPKIIKSISDNIKKEYLEYSNEKYHVAIISKLMEKNKRQSNNTGEA